MKTRKFAAEGPNKNIDDDTRDRAESEVRRRSVIEGLQREAGRTQGAVVKNTAPTRNKVVTKEQLQASGLNLRDYMNEQKGLTRRGSPAPTPIDLAESAIEMRRNARGGKPDQLSGEARRLASSGDPTAGEAQDPEEQAAADAIGDAEYLRTRSYTPRRPADPNYIRNTRIGSQGYAKGGSVSSRADGIAQRGKTRGRMC